MPEATPAPDSLPIGSGPHHSIGEVLSLLKEEHEDVTISKIRFLESQGLINPERTPSGYRKFYNDDVERLRWVLAQQRDNFLPLKVIKQRMAEAGFDPTAELPARDTELPAHETEALPEPALFNRPADTVSLSAGELAEAVGSDIGFIGELDRLGLIEAVDTGAGRAFDHQALLVAQAAVGLQSHGLDARHLRMFKVAADRESGVLGQVARPGLSRGGAAEEAALAVITEMVRLGDVLRHAVIRRNFGAPFDE